MAAKLLRRSKTNRSILGVCGGLGEYFDIDPVLLRVAWVVLSLTTGLFPGIIAYIIVGMVIPESSK